MDAKISSLIKKDDEEIIKVHNESTILRHDIALLRLDVALTMDDAKLFHNQLKVERQNG